MQWIHCSNRLQLMLALLGTVLLNACAAPPSGTPDRVAASMAAHASYPAHLHGAQLYRVDAKASSVHVLVYRGGTMARLGHNHVITATKLNGYFWRGNTLDDSGFDIVVPVNELAVDDDAARIAEGADFPLNVDEAAKQATRKNMLSEAVLGGAYFPAITLKSVAMSGAMATPLVTAALRIRDRTREVAVPVTLEARDDQLTVQGEFSLRQSDFGIVPFRVAMGTLFVVDSVTVKFNLVGQHINP